MCYLLVSENDSQSLNLSVLLANFCSYCHQILQSKQPVALSRRLQYADLLTIYMHHATQSFCMTKIKDINLFVCTLTYLPFFADMRHHLSHLTPGRQHIPKSTFLIFDIVCKLAPSRQKPRLANDLSCNSFVCASSEYSLLRRVCECLERHLQRSICLDRPASFFEEQKLHVYWWADRLTCATQRKVHLPRC